MRTWACSVHEIVQFPLGQDVKRNETDIQEIASDDDLHYKGRWSSRDISGSNFLLLQIASSANLSAGICIHIHRLDESVRFRIASTRWCVVSGC